MSSGQHAEKRVQFDFVVTFANGSGLRGQDFRLDMSGDDSSDAELANYLIRDLRLLMAQSVQIANKWVITEPHKRGIAAVADEPAAVFPILT